MDGLTAPIVDNSGGQLPVSGVTPAASAEPAQPAAAPQEIPPGVDPRTVMKNPIAELLGANINPGTPEGLEPLAPVGDPAAPAPAATAQPGITGEIDPALVPDKFKNPDGTINYVELARGYREIESLAGRQGNQLNQMQRQLQELQRGPQPGQPQQTAPVQPEPPQMTPEQIKEMNERFLESFYENPIQTVYEMAANIAREAVQPIAQTVQQGQQVQTFSSEIEAFAEQNPDMVDVYPDMVSILEANPHIADFPNALDTLYKMAKGQKYGTPPPAPPTLEQLLQDPANLQKVLENPAVKNAILSNYAQSVKAGQPPVVIGSQPGAVPPAAAPVEIKSTTDAKKATMGFFQRMLGGPR